MKNIKHQKITGVYCILNTINSKIYIGSSKDIYRRIAKHFSELRKNKHNNAHLQSAFNKYSEEAFDVFVVKETQEQVSWEQFYIDY